MGCVPASLAATSAQRMAAEDVTDQAPTKKPRRERKREERWGQAKTYEELSAGRRKAAVVVDFIEDALLVLSLGVLGLVLLAHLFVSMRVSLGFIAIHEQLIRSFWFIERMETGEYGMWPGIIAAFGQDAVFMGGLMLVVMMPFALVRRFIFDDERSVGDVVTSTLGGTVATLVATYLVGAIAGTFVMLIVAGVASSGTPAEGLLAPVTSGILVTDLGFTAVLWWDDRASSPRAPRMRFRGAAGAALAFAFFALLAMRPVVGHVDVGEQVAGTKLYVEGEHVKHDGDLIVRTIADTRDDLDFDEGEWTANGQLNAFGPGPFLMGRTSFYHSPFTETWLADGETHVSYTLAPWTKTPKRSEKVVTLKPDAGKGFYDQFELVTPREVFWGGTAVSARKRDVTQGVSWGLFVKNGSGESFYVLADGAEVRLLEIGKPAVVLARYEADAPVERLAVRGHYAFGLTVFVEDEPRWTVAMGLTAVGAGMVRRPKLQDDDEATLEMTIDRAEPADADVVAEALRNQSSVL